MASLMADNLPQSKTETKSEAKSKGQKKAGVSALETRLALDGLWTHTILPNGDCAFEAFRHQLLATSPGLVSI